MNHWESPQRNFRLVCKSPRIYPKEISEFFVNNQELLRIAPKKFQTGSEITKNQPQRNFKSGLWITENHQELPPKKFHSDLWITNNHLRITPKKFQSGLQITENCPKESVPEKFHKSLMNCWESPRITPKKFQSGLQITKNHWKSAQRYFRVFHELPRIAAESPQRNFRVVCKSLRITPKKFQHGSWITENHHKEISEWFAKHWESPRINENHQELPQRNLRVFSWITENC